MADFSYSILRPILALLLQNFPNFPVFGGFIYLNLLRLFVGLKYDLKQYFSTNEFSLKPIIHFNSRFKESAIFMKFAYLFSAPLISTKLMISICLDFVPFFEFPEVFYSSFYLAN
jgi:hypothetical protein